MSRLPPASWWLVIKPDDVDVCDVDPGYPVTVTVTTTLPRMVEIWRGDRAWAAALRSGVLEMQGTVASASGCPSVVHAVGVSPRCLGRLGQDRLTAGGYTRPMSLDGGHPTLHRAVERPVAVRVPRRDRGDARPGTAHDFLGVAHRVGMVVELGLVLDLHRFAGDLEVQVEVDPQEFVVTGGVSKGAAA